MIKNEDLLETKKDEITIYKIALEEKIKDNQKEQLIQLTMSLREAKSKGIRYSVATLEDIQTADEVVPELIGANIVNVAEGMAKWVKRPLLFNLLDELEYSENWELIRI